MLGLFAMAVGCPFPECTYTIPDDVTDQQLMNTCLYGHIQAMHSGPSSAPHEATGKSRLEKISRPSIRPVAAKMILSFSRVNGIDIRPILRKRMIVFFVII